MTRVEIRRQHVVGKPGPVGRHGVLADDGPERDDLGVRPEVAHHAHRPHREEHGEGLPERAAEPRRLDLLLHDGVGVADHLEPLLGHLAQDAHGEPRAGERLAPDDLRRQAEKLAEHAHLVLEELPQRLHQREAEVLRQPARRCGGS